MTNNQSSYAKSFAIKSIMGNPKLSNVLFDSWNAPVGSTKTAHAKSVMKSLERSANNYVADGRGGPGLQPQYAFNPISGDYEKKAVDTTVSKLDLSPSTFSASPFSKIAGQGTSELKSVLEDTSMDKPPFFAGSSPTRSSEKTIMDGQVDQQGYNFLTPIPNDLIEATPSFSIRA